MRTKHAKKSCVVLWGQLSLLGAFETSKDAVARSQRTLGNSGAIKC